MLCTVTGSTDFVRFPRRPRAEVEFLATAALPAAADQAQEFASALLDELRERVPPQPAGRRA